MVFEGIRSLPLEWDVILRVCASSLNRVRPTAHTYPKSRGVSPRLDQRFRNCSIHCNTRRILANSYYFAMKHLNTEYIEQKNFFASLPWNESVKRLPAVFHDILICQCRVAFGRCGERNFSSSQTKNCCHLLC